MPDRRTTAIEKFAGLRALVIGDVMLDSYFSGPSQRLCQEAPVPIVDVSKRVDMPGGAANCAVNLARLGASAQLLGVHGCDCEGELLHALLEESGVRIDSLLPVKERGTLFKSRVFCDNHLVVRFDQGSTNLISKEAERFLLARLESAYAKTDVVIVSDYGYGNLTPTIIQRIGELQRRTPRVLVVDSKNLLSYGNVGMTLCKPNFRETLKLLGLPSLGVEGKRWDSLIAEGNQVLELTGSQIAAVTLDREGALIFVRGQPVFRTFARSAPQKHAAGAGDTFLSTFGLALAAGCETPDAADMASAAAAVVVGKEYTATCSREELTQRLDCDHQARGDLAALLPVLEEYRRQNRQIVLTNGCFDILHRGHIAYLEQARQLGDVLIVGVNTDESIQRLKGPTRPINSLIDRMSVLAALSSVDHVVPFGEDTPHRLIEAIRPDVFVKGGDYTRATLPEAELVERLGGTVKILPFLSDRSTTSIISRIRSQQDPKDNPLRAPEGGEHVQSVGNRAAVAVRSA